MRITVTIDDDTAELLKKRARERDVTFNRVLNEAVRAGLAGDVRAANPDRMKPRKLGARPGVDLTKALGPAADLDDAEVVRELEQGR